MDKNILIYIRSIVRGNREGNKIPKAFGAIVIELFETKREREREKKGY